jgi:hypothetical protein
MLALLAVTASGLLALLLRQQLCPQQGWRAMQLLLQLSRASLWLLCGSHWWHEQVRRLAVC